MFIWSIDQAYCESICGMYTQLISSDDYVFIDQRQFSYFTAQNIEQKA